MCGYTPFLADSAAVMFRRVEKGILHVQFPPKATAALQDFIVRMLQSKPNERLPMLPGGICNLERHTWLQSLDWDGLRDGRLEAPFKPSADYTSIPDYCMKN